MFLLNLSSHFHIYIAKYLFPTNHDKFQNLGETTVLAYEINPFRFPSVVLRGCLRDTGTSFILVRVHPFHLLLTKELASES